MRTYFIRDCINRRISEAFIKWRNEAIVHRERILRNAKVLMVRATSIWLKNYFEFWKQSKGRQKKKKKMMIFDETEQEKFELQNEINIIN